MADASSSASTRSASSRTGGRLRLWIALAIGLAAAVYAAAFSFGVVHRIDTPFAWGPARLPEAAARTGDLRLFEVLQRTQRTSGQAAGARQATPDASAMLLASQRSFSPADRAAIRGAALDVLRTTPLESSGLRQLAFLEPDLAKRERLLDLAHSVTRRDVMAALQLAELRLRRDEVTLGLSGLNRALVVSRSLDETVFPMLAGAAVNREAAAQIGGLLKRDPEWAERLVRWTIANPQALAPISLVLGNLPEDSPARAPGYGQQMIDILAGQGRFAEAFAVYRAYGPGEQKLGDLTVGLFPPIDWRLIDNYDTGARAFGEGTAEIFANPGRQGEVAQVVTRLRPGAQRLSVRIDETVGSDGELLLSAVCLEGLAATPLAEQRMRLADGVATMAFAPAPSCRFQRLSIGIAAGNESAGALIRSVSLGGA